MFPYKGSMAPAPRVFIIDAEPVNRRLAEVLFQKLGWQAETLDSGERALQRMFTP
jgi:CheY-like chemotaxis protein